MFIASKYDRQRHQVSTVHILLLPALILLLLSVSIVRSQEPEVVELPSQTFVVISTSDSTAPGTLRQAINDANANPGLDTIAFNIPGTGIQTLSIGSVLPTITGPVMIDGTTQPGYSGTPLIFIKANGSSEALNITAGGSTLKGITVGHFVGATSNGVVHFGTTGGNVVTGCTFGIRGDNVGDYNSNDALVIDGITNNRIGGVTPTERNYFGGGDFNTGVILKNGASNNRITGNWFGVAPNGQGVLQRTSINVVDSPNNIIGGTAGVTPGGACTGECNVITGNQDQSAGLYIMGAASTGNIVIGNFVGLLADGHTPNANRVIGVRITGAANNRIGGTTAAERNILSANNTSSVRVDGGGADGNMITGNYIGTDSTGMARSTTLGVGVSISTGATNTIIGGTVGTTLGGSCTGACNVISGNGNNGTSSGVSIIGSSGNVVDGNYIGLNAAGTAPMLNGIKPDLSRFDGDAIILINASNNTIGRRGVQFDLASIKKLDGPATSPVYCVQDDLSKDYVKFDQGTHELIEAKDCKSDLSFSAHGTIGGYPSFVVFETDIANFFTFAEADVNLDNGKASGEIAISSAFAGHLISKTIFDSNVNDSDCMCSTVGVQVVDGPVVLSGQGGDSNNDFVGGLLSGLSANGTYQFINPLTKSPFLNEFGNNNTFENIYVYARNQPPVTVSNGTGNLIDDLLAATGLSPFVPFNVSPSANGGLVPPTGLTIQRTLHGATIDGVVTGPANSTVRVNYYGEDHALPGNDPTLLHNLTDLRVSVDVPVGPSGAAEYQQIFSREETEALVRAQKLAATSALFDLQTQMPTSTSQMSQVVAVPEPYYDEDDDGETDLGVYREGPMSYEFWQESYDDSFHYQQFGTTGDELEKGDYDGDRIPNFAVWRPANGTWYIGQPQGDPGINFYGFQWGLPTDIPVSGDFDGDGRNDLGTFRDGIWYIRDSTGGDLFPQQWGTAKDRLVPADYNGDGRTDLAVYRNGDWYISVCPTCPTLYYNFGLANDIPVPADYDGDGSADVAVFRNGTWYVNGTTAGFFARQWGQSGDIPLYGDFDGDGLYDIGVFRPTDGNWYILKSRTGTPFATHFGRNGDIPIPSFEARYHY